MNASFVPSSAMPVLQNSRFPIRSLLLALACALPVGAVHAELADKDKPLNIEADSLRYEDAKQLSVFTGKVVATKGTIIMRGARMEVRQDPQGNQFGLLVGGPNALAFFRQKREGVDEWIEGEGERIEYESASETVVFTGKAVMRRYRGTQLNDESSGTQITYSSATEVYTVKGGAAGTATASNPSGRVRAMLTPIPDEQAKPAPATAPAQLRSTNTLPEQKQ